jgi:glycosyltransferase involved in cell wall biosynthesis
VHIQEILAGLRRIGWEADLVAPAYSRGWTRPSLPARLAQYFWMQVRLAFWIRRYGILYVRAHYMALPICLIAKLAGVPTVHEINGPYEDVFVAYPGALRLRSLLVFAQRLQYRLADGLIAVTAGLQAWAMRQAGRNDCVLIPNGANVELFRPGVPAGRSLPARYAIFVGGLAPWHGIATLLAAARAPDWPTDVSLVVVGDGPEAPRVREAAAQNPRIVMLGRLAYRDVPGLIAGAVAGIVPISDPGGRSRTGLAPIKLFETLACGIPAIVSDLPEQAELVRRNRCGLVFATDDEAALALAVAKIATDPDTAGQMGQRGRELVAREHSWECRARATDHYLRTILARANH